MDIWGWLILGALAGWLGSLLMGERQGLAMHVIVGTVGAMVGGFLFNRFGEPAVTGLNLWSFFVAVVGALLLLAFFRAIRGPQLD